MFAIILSYFSLTFVEFKCALFAKKQFKFKTARNRHEKTVHIGSIERECQSCGKKIKRKDNFDRHVRTCQNLTKCPYCVEHFRTSNLKRLHIQTEHKEHVFRRNNCQRTFLTLRNVNLSLQNGSTEQWISLLSSAIGYVLPNPSMKPYKL